MLIYFKIFYTLIWIPSDRTFIISQPSSNTRDVPHYFYFNLDLSKTKIQIKETKEYTY